MRPSIACVVLLLKFTCNSAFFDVSGHTVTLGIRTVRVHSEKLFRHSSWLHVGQSQEGDIFSMVRRKESEVSRLHTLHKDPSDDLQLLMSYMDVESTFESAKKMAKAFRRQKKGPSGEATTQLSVGIDLKRKSPTNPSFRCGFSNAGQVAAAFASSKADFVFANVDQQAYGGDIIDLQEIVKAANKDFPDVPVIYKDIVIDPIQLALAKHSGCDGCLVMACIVGAELPNLLNTATLMNLPVVVECHTAEEVSIAVENGAGTILLNRVDRFGGNEFFADQVRVCVCVRVCVTREVE